jgi:hypothetical protein
MQSQTTPGNVVTAQLTSQGVQATWSGHGKGEFRIGGRAVDLQTPGRALRLHYRIDETPQGPVVLSMRCEAPAAAPTPASASMKRCGMADGEGVDLTQSFGSVHAGSWSTLTLPLACLHRAAGTLERVGAPFALESSGRLGVTFDDIRFVRDPAAACPPQPH